MRIKFEEEKQSYKIMVENERYIIATKPFNARKTYLYVIVDKVEKIRGADNYIMGRFNYSDLEECQEALKELSNGVMDISRRNRVPLKIEWIK